MQLRGLNDSTKGHLRPLKEIIFSLYYQPPSCLSLPAVYLCKRTMQNKARLELADYEAVSERGLIVSALPSSHMCSQALSLAFLFILKLRKFVCFFVCFIICYICYTDSKKLFCCVIHKRECDHLETKSVQRRYV